MSCPTPEARCWQISGEVVGSGFEKVIMNIWQTVLLEEAATGLRAIFAAFGQRYFGPQERAAVNTVINALADLPNRIAAAGGAK